MELIIALLIIAALTALIYHSFWGRGARYYYIELPDPEEIVYRDGLRTVIKRGGED